MAADHEFVLPPDLVLPDMGQTTEPFVGVIELGVTQEVVLPSQNPMVTPYVEWIGSDNGGGGGGSCEDTRPDTGMLYPRG